MEARSRRTSLLSADQARRLEVDPWNQIAPLRAADIDKGTDSSYRYVTKPIAKRLVGRHRAPGVRRLLDIGCGVGRLTRELATEGTAVHAIDPSPVSAELAAQHLKMRATVQTATLREFVQANPPREKFDVCTAFMVMQDLVDIDAFLADVRRLLSARGRFIASITHPYFWPTYWNYDSAPWFNYSRELFVKTEFRTSGVSYAIDTFHAHRPLEMYVKALVKSRLSVRRIYEPMMPDRGQRIAGVNWQYPHFLFLEAVPL